LTLVKISAAAFLMLPPPPIVALSGSCVMGEPYEVLYLAVTGVLATPARSAMARPVRGSLAGVDALGPLGAGDGLAVARTRRLGGMAAMVSAVP
jgi:hypothetical protein